MKKKKRQQRFVRKGKVESLPAKSARSILQYSEVHKFIPDKRFRDDGLQIMTEGRHEPCVLPIWGF